MTSRQRTARPRRTPQEEAPSPAAPNETIQVAAVDSAVVRRTQQPESEPNPRRRAGPRRLRLYGAGVWIGLVLVAGGFGLIAYTWGKTAGLVNVAQQIPYLVSGGLSALGLILLGILVVNLSVKRREALERARQLEELRDAMAQLRTALDGGESEEAS